VGGLKSPKEAWNPYQAPVKRFQEKIAKKFRRKLKAKPGEKRPSERGPLLSRADILFNQPHSEDYIMLVGSEGAT